jgi:hypothetical protein
MPNKKSGVRKDGKSFKEGNTRPDGSYQIGRARPPIEGQFAKGDGRKRGRRSKGTKNFETEFLAEANELVPMNEQGKVRRYTKRRAALKRLFLNGIVKGQTAAISLIMEHSRRIEEKAGSVDRSVRMSDFEILEAFLQQRAAFEDPQSLEDRPSESGENENSDPEEPTA